MESSQVDYILHYYSQLMNENESAAWKHWSTNYKIIHSNSSEHEMEVRARLMTEKGWLSNDENVLNLLKDGIDKFRENTAERIFSEHPEILNFNYC